MTKKQDLGEYLTTVKTVKPSAEVAFKTTNSEGEVEETVASREYVAEHMDKELDIVENMSGLRDRLDAISKRNQEKLVEKVLEDEALDDSIEDIEDEVEDEQLQENAEVAFSQAEKTDDDSPFTSVPNAKEVDPAQTTAQMSETALLIELISKLIDKIDDMQNFNPVIHVPAPVIHVSLPETRKTVTRAIERDENNFIKTVRESIDEVPEGEPLIETFDENPKPKPKPKAKKKDSE